MGMTRRSLLMGAGLLATADLMAGCAQKSADTLAIRVLKGTIPPQMEGRFRQLQRKAGTAAKLPLSIKPEPKLEGLFKLLQTIKQQDGNQSTQRGLPFFPQGSSQSWIDLLTLGDYWLATAITQGLLQPFDVAGWERWTALPQRWQALVTRDEQGNPTSSGKVWAAPYSWGTTLIVYRADRFAAEGWQPPTDWADLWRSDLHGWVSLPENPREVIGLTLKHLKQSYNVPDLTAVKGLEPQLVALNQQAKLYSSDSYLQPLILGDTAVAVGWSTDILPLLRSDRAANSPDKRKFAAVVPLSGTALWANLWVRPAFSSLSPNTQTLLNQWIDFCWQTDVAIQLSLLSGATSPIVPTLDPTRLPANLLAEPLLLPSSQIFDRSEFLLPLAPETINQYRQLWRTIRRTTTAV